MNMDTLIEYDIYQVVDSATTWRPVKAEKKKNMKTSSR